MSTIQKNLGEILKEAREVSELTLRQVEENTGISNAYLSQVENNVIKKPSANILYKLSKVYGLNFDSLLSQAGIIEDKAETDKSLYTVFGSSLALSNLSISSEEEKELVNYLHFLRYKNKK